MQTRYKRQSSLNSLLSEHLSKRVKINNNNNNSDDQHTFMDIDKCEEKTINNNNVQASIFLLVKFIISSIYIGCKLRLRKL
jgi:hypothetical protein